MAKSCAAPDCPKPAHGRGRYCGMHARRLRVHGDLDASLQPTWIPAEDAVLLAMPRYERSGHTKHGELNQASLALGRTWGACRKRIATLRARGAV